MKKLLLFLTVILMLTGCGKKDDDVSGVPDEPDTPIEEPLNEIPVLSEEEQQTVLKNFYDLLGTSTDKDKLIDYADENIAAVEEKIADEMILGIEGFMSAGNAPVNEVGGTLYKYSDYASAEIKSYLSILNQESEKLFSDGESVFVDLDTLISRAISAEHHINNYPEGRTSKMIREYFKAYISSAIQGAGNQYIYAAEGSSVISEENLFIYEEAITNNQGTKTASILSEYLESLSMDGNNLNGENVIQFYDNMSSIINI